MEILLLLTSLMMLVYQIDCDLQSSPQVFITVAAKASVNLNGESSVRQIQLNWYNAKPLIGDWIGLFTQDPSINHSTPQFKSLIFSKEGIVNTNITMPKLSRQLSLKKQCLGFWVAYTRDTKILVSNCFKIQPTWMWDNYDSIRNMSLSQLMIPGTHDAGSFQSYKGWKSENILTKYLITQENNFYEQFVHGIRHLDIRIAYYDTIDEFWLVHGTFRTNPFLPQLENIKKFIRETNEILILDFHSFEHGFSDILDKADISRHRTLISLLVKELGNFLIPRNYGYNVPLEALWKFNKRILICYNFGDYHKTNKYLWPGIYQAWPNTVNLSDLKTFFNNFMSKPIKYPLWSAQAEFTEDTTYIFSNPGSGLRELADAVNPDVTKYFRDFWWDKANIIATDFFEGNNIIDVSISTNKKRAKLLNV